MGQLSSEKDSRGEARLAPAAVVTTGNTSGDHGDSDGTRIRIDARDGSLAHEIGHTFRLSDNYSGGGVMASPPDTSVSPTEVDEIVNKSYVR